MVDLNPEKAEKYLDRYADSLERASLAGTFRQEMGELNKQERQIRADKDMSASEKRKMLDEIRKVKIEMASDYREALGS
jgi:hypothetical protein